jgi:hypothetical protein
VIHSAASNVLTMNRFKSIAAACLVVLTAQKTSAGSDVNLTWIAGSSVKVEQLIGDGDYAAQATTGQCKPTTSRTSTRSKVLGTDRPASALFLDFLTNSDGSSFFAKVPGVRFGARNSGMDRNLPQPDANAYSVLTRFDETSRRFTFLRTISSVPNGRVIITSLHAGGMTS